MLFLLLAVEIDGGQVLHARSKRSLYGFVLRWTFARCLTLCASLPVLPVANALSEPCFLSQDLQVDCRLAFHILQSLVLLNFFGPWYSQKHYVFCFLLGVLGAGVA